MKDNVCCWRRVDGVGGVLDSSRGGADGYNFIVVVVLGWLLVVDCFSRFSVRCVGQGEFLSEFVFSFRNENWNEGLSYLKFQFGVVNTTSTLCRN